MPQLLAGRRTCTKLEVTVSQPVQPPDARYGPEAILSSADSLVQARYTGYSTLSVFTGKRTNSSKCKAILCKLCSHLVHNMGLQAIWSSVA